MRSESLSEKSENLIHPPEVVTVRWKTLGTFRNQKISAAQKCKKQFNTSYPFFSPRTVDIKG